MGMKIKEVIVVEGKHDSDRLKSFFDCDTIETQGTHLSKDVIVTLQEIHKKRGILVFTDPDYPGEYIRKKISEYIPDAKHAFICKSLAKTSKKVGVEHASKEALQASLEHVVTFCEKKEESISKEDFYMLGFVGQENSAMLREKVGNALFIGKCNAKTLYKRINMLGLDKAAIKKVMEELYE